ncbi:hypothetical protein E4U43_002865, partial [Claviceps pusilla]
MRCDSDSVQGKQKTRKRNTDLPGRVASKLAAGAAGAAGAAYAGKPDRFPTDLGQSCTKDAGTLFHGFSTEVAGRGDLLLGRAVKAKMLRAPEWWISLASGRCWSGQNWPGRRRGRRETGDWTTFSRSDEGNSKDRREAMGEAQDFWQVKWQAGCSTPVINDGRDGWDQVGMQSRGARLDFNPGNAGRARVRTGVSVHCGAISGTRGRFLKLGRAASTRGQSEIQIHSRMFVAALFVLQYK